MDGKAAGNQVELVIIKRKALVEIQIGKSDAVVNLCIFLVGMVEQFIRDITTGNVSIPLKVVVKREAMFAFPTADIQDRHAFGRLQQL
jgi:hypothetical protein